MTSYLFDTNVVSSILKGEPNTITRLVSLPTNAILIPAITVGELHFGLARRNYPKVLSAAVNAFLIRVNVMPWTQEIAKSYGMFRANCEAKGLNLDGLDMMIAAHARALDDEPVGSGSNVILVTEDKAFSHVFEPGQLENWAKTALIPSSPKHK